MMGFILVTVLLTFDLSGRFRTEIRKHFGHIEKKLKRQCENCIWGRHFKKHTISYKGGRELKRDILENITVLSENECKRKQFLVYKCDSTMLCGGLADRQKGVVSTFLMALLTKRVFVIDVTSPCRLEEFLLSNLYNWSLCNVYIKTIPRQNISSLNFVEKYNFNQEIKNFDFEGNWTKDAVVIRFNSYAIDGIRQHKYATERLKWLLDMTNEESIHRVLNTLFKPNNRLLNDALQFYDNRVNGRKLICCHIRKGKNPSIPTDNNLRFGPPNETLIFEYLKQYDKNSEYAIYIAADSDQVKQSARSNITSYININRTIVHVDRLGAFEKRKTIACDGFYAAILEQFILSLCDSLILTRSGFGTMAAYMRGVSYNLYMYHPKTKRIVGTNLTNIQTVFNFL